MNTDQRQNSDGSPALAPVSGSTASALVITSREELAVIVERLRHHEREATDQYTKVRLDLAADLVRSAMFRL